MAAQKQAIVELVEAQCPQGRTVAEVLGSVGVARSSYYGWKKGQAQPGGRRQSPYEVTAEEKKLIDEVKGKYPCIDIGASRDYCNSGACICRCR